MEPETTLAQELDEMVRELRTAAGLARNPEVRTAPMTLQEACTELRFGAVARPMTTTNRGCGCGRCGG